MGCAQIFAVGAKQTSVLQLLPFSFSTPSVVTRLSTTGGSNDLLGLGFNPHGPIPRCRFQPKADATSAHTKLANRGLFINI